MYYWYTWRVLLSCHWSKTKDTCRALLSVLTTVSRFVSGVRSSDLAYLKTSLLLINWLNAHVHCAFRVLLSSNKSVNYFTYTAGYSFDLFSDLTYYCIHCWLIAILLHYLSLVIPLRGFVWNPFCYCPALNFSFLKNRFGVICRDIYSLHLKVLFSASKRLSTHSFKFFWNRHIKKKKFKM